MSSSGNRRMEMNEMVRNVFSSVSSFPKAEKDASVTKGTSVGATNTIDRMILPTFKSRRTTQPR